MSQTTRRENSITVHRGAPAWTEVLVQDAHCIVGRDVLQDVNRTVEITVRQRRDDDVADAAVVYAWNLVCWCLDHDLPFR